MLPENAIFSSELPDNYKGDIAIKLTIDDEVATIIFIPKKELELNFSTHKSTFSEVAVALLSILLSDLDKSHKVEFTKVAYTEIEPADYMA